MLYAGIDAHRRRSYVTVMDDKGKVLKCKEIGSTRSAVRAALGRYRQPVKAVLEASYSWAPMYDWLGEVVDDVVLAHPAKVRAIAEARIKTDKIDSLTLAHLLRADLIPMAHAPDKEVRAARRVLRHRMAMVRMSTMVKNRIHALLAQHAVEKLEVSDLYGRKGMTWLRAVELPEPDLTVFRENVSLLETLQDHIATSDGLVADLAAGDEVVDWLRSIPGIGAFFSVLIRYEIDDISRFASPKKLASYTGLIPSTYASGEKCFHGRLTKQGNRWLRWAFVEAALRSIARDGWLRRYHTRIKHRKGNTDARVATARKLAEIVWHVWTERRPFEKRS